MVSDKFMVNSDDGRMAAARYATESFALQARLDKRSTLWLSLLVEETLGMMKAMMNDFYGRLWFSGDEKGCEIHLEATANMDGNRKHELLSISSTGKNAAAKGFMSMVGEVISRAVHSYGCAMDQAYASGAVSYGYVPTGGAGISYMYDITPVWTLQQYKTNLEQGHQNGDQLDAAAEDLEKSIVANLADDVVVGIKGDRIELIITKHFDKVNEA